MNRRPTAFEPLRTKPSQRERKRLEILRRRVDYLRVRLRHEYISDGVRGWSEAEVVALEWAIETIEAAILLGHMDEISGVRGVDEADEP